MHSSRSPMLSLLLVCQCHRYWLCRTMGWSICRTTWETSLSMQLLPQEENGGGHTAKRKCSCFVIPSVCCRSFSSPLWYTRRSEASFPIATHSRRWTARASCSTSITSSIVSSNYGASSSTSTGCSKTLSIWSPTCWWSMTTPSSIAIFSLATSC